jgi:RecJ-like exonuclease
VKNLSYDLIHTKWELNNAWKMLKHEISIPTHYFYDSTEECKACNGKGYKEHKTVYGNKTIIKRETCTICNGEGIIHTKTTKDIFNEIFNTYLSLKKQRNEIIKLLKDKAWEDENYSSYKEAHPYGYWEVCIRCNNYFDSIENLNACHACTNESMIPENGCNFDPVDEGARKWFIDKGYKKCIGYTPKFKRWRNKYINK